MCEPGLTSVEMSASTRSSVVSKMPSAAPSGRHSSFPSTAISTRATGDVPSTMADVSQLESAVGFRPRTSVREGVARFVDWYRKYYGV